MKKFLFTLAALMMAGSAFAWEQAGGNNPTGDYFYAEDVQLTTDDLGQEYYEIPLMAHFDHYVSAFRVFFNLPEGLTYNGVEVGSGLTLSYTNRQGRPASSVVMPADDYTDNKVTILVQHTIQTYENGTAIGVAHWAPGDYEMMYMYLAIDANYSGTNTISMTTEPTSGGYQGYDADLFVHGAQQITSFTIAAPAGPVEPVVAPVPTIGYDDNGDVVATCEGHTTVLMLNGQEEANVVNQPYALPAQTWEAQTLNFYAYTVAGAGEDENSAIVGPFVVNIDALQPVPATAPEIVVENGQVTAVAAGHQTVLMLDGEVVAQPYELPAQTWEIQTLNFSAYTVAGEHETNSATVERTVTIDALQPVPATAPEIVVENGQVTAVAAGHQTVLMLDGEVVAQPYELPAQTWEVQTLNFSAYTVAGEHETNSATVERTVTIDALQPTAAPKPNLVEENGQVVASCEGHEVVLMLEGEVVANPYTLPAATDVEQVLHFTATTVPGEHEIAGEAAELTVTIPAATPELPTCLAPNSSYAITGTETATVTIVNREDGATVNVQVYVNGVLDETLSTTFTGETYSFTVTGDATYEVHAIATKTGYNNSADGGVFFTITEGEEPTGISELVNGKQIAGVRYFNMAGQEMQEANGMTIVVTTYTDGTTSAVKVMK